ncbi:hypothetical protein NDU88_002116 [Pleurodeles waltl]|uniref:Uncharacterized protein n=1 Tax=Pleurodeles waltl TaxID=8319 RepID=A0AAV7PAQ1_PLEWA|nr:hypothetical protein NDU88_002116 [Pleurodeles waltl]
MGICDGAAGSAATPRYPGGTYQWEEGPGVPSCDYPPDPEAVQSVSGNPEWRTVAAGIHKSHSRHMWERQEAEDGFRRSAEAEPEGRDQLTSWSAGSQEEDGAKSGLTLESVATPGTIEKSNKDTL